jgi:hypothetical protein
LIPNRVHTSRNKTLSYLIRLPATQFAFKTIFSSLKKKTTVLVLKLSYPDIWTREGQLSHLPLALPCLVLSCLRVVRLNLAKEML